MTQTTGFNRDHWNGDPDQLPESMDHWRHEHFEDTFMSKQEAFWAGWERGYRQEEREALRRPGAGTAAPRAQLS
jgi:hypothetical protein